MFVIWSILMLVITYISKRIPYSPLTNLATLPFVGADVVCLAQLLRNSPEFLILCFYEDTLC